MDLPKNDHSFTFSEKGERTRKTYEGQFTVKCLLSMEEIRQAGIKLDLLNGGSRTLPGGVALLNRAFAELSVRIIKAPSWWTDSNEGRELFDTNVVLEVFNKAIDAERVWDERITKAADDAEAATAPKPSKKKES